MHAEDQKTPEQKEREAHLLRSLLELIDERDKLERRKMNTERRYLHVHVDRPLICIVVVPYTINLKIISEYLSIWVCARGILRSRFSVLW